VARTPSAEAHEKVLKAACKLIAERGIESTSMDAIAAESGVSKATVYKHWANKDALLIDVLRSFSDKLPEFESENAREDMLQLMRFFARAKRRDELTRIWPRIMGYAMSNQDFARALNDFAFQPRRDLVERIIGRAVRAGELREEVDPEFAMDLLIGPILHRRFRCDPVAEDLPDRIVDYFWKIFSQPTHEYVRPRTSGSRKNSRS
jgi:AcrR family transcriptional regulator